MERLVLTRNILFTVFLVIPGVPASAAPLLFIRVQAGGDGSPGGPAGGYTSQSAGTLSTVGSVPGSTASASGRVDFGSLGAKARIDTGSLCDPPSTGPTDPCQKRGTSARVESRWSDDFTITSNVLADDTWVDFEFTLLLDGMLGMSDTYVWADASPPSYYGVSAQTRLDGLPEGPFALQKVRRVEYGILPPPTLLGETRTSRDDGDLLTVQSRLQVGRTYTLTQSLFVFATASSMFNVWATADYFNSAHLVVQAEDSAVGYTTSSGTRYDAAQVPEAHMVGLIAVGVLSALSRRRQVAIGPRR